MWSLCIFVFTCLPGESYRRQLRSLLSHLCYVFRALINSLVCWSFISVSSGTCTVSSTNEESMPHLSHSPLHQCVFKDMFSFYANEECITQLSHSPHHQCVFKGMFSFYTGEKCITLFTQPPSSVCFQGHVQFLHWWKMHNTFHTAPFIKVFSRTCSVFTLVKNA